MIRRLAIALAVIAAIFLGGGLLLPREATVSRSTVIAAPPQKVFDLVNGYKRFHEWSPWQLRDPQAKYSLSGPATGKGARMSWSSEKDDVGSGTQEIVESVPGRLVRVKLDFADMDGGEASFTLEPAGGGTRVTWGFTTDLGSNPMQRWMGLMLDRWIGADYEKGLAKLKTVAEAP